MVLTFVFLSLPTVQLTYDRICEKEPIGRELFRQFCAGNAELQRAIVFLDEVVSEIDFGCPNNPAQIYQHSQLVHGSSHKGIIVSLLFPN